MATSVNNKIIVSVNMTQKDYMEINGVKIKMGMAFEKNYREKSPVIAKVERGNNRLKQGDIIICHHNHFYPPSPYHLGSNLYSIPVNHTIFAILKENGDLQAVYKNVLGERVDIETYLPLGPDRRKQYSDRIIITDPGGTKYKVGQMIFTRPSSPYEIVYNIGGVIMRKIKVNSDMIVGVLK